MISKALPDSATCAQALRRIARSLDAAQPVGALDEPDVHLVLGLAIAFFGDRYERGEAISDFPQPPIEAPTTAAMVTASAILKGCDVELFELGMWQTFGGRH